MKGGLDSLFRTLLKGFDVQKGNAWLCDSNFIDLYAQILTFRPEERIPPYLLLKHEFMAGYVPHFMQSKYNVSASVEDKEELYRE